MWPTLPISAESSHCIPVSRTSTLTTVKSIFHRLSTTRQPQSTDSLVVLKTGCLAERQLVTLESFQVLSLMAGLEIFSGQDHCPSRAGPVFISPGLQVVDSARDLDVVINSHLTMADLVTAVCRAAYFHSSATTTPDHKLTVLRCNNDARAEFYHLS